MPTKKKTRQSERLIKEGYIRICIYNHRNKLPQISTLSKIISLGEKFGASEKSKIDFCMGERSDGYTALFVKPFSPQ